MKSLKHVVRNILRTTGYDIRAILNDSQLLDTVKLSYVLEKLIAIDKSIDESTTRSDVLKMLRALSLSDFGLFMLSIPNPDVPKLSALLPKMADPDVQVSWTGTSGLELLKQSLDFTRSVSYSFTKATGRPLNNANILDFGCGYGRITRLMYYFSDEDQIYAVDPWDRSIDICKNDGLTKNFLLSDYLPSTLPVPSNYFDFIFAFSVFTHLSERATRICLNTLADYLRPDGLIAITIRPIEYWNVDLNAVRLGVIEKQKVKHNQNGFSFLPHDRAPVDGDVTYGDTSMTLEWLASSFQRLKIVGVDRSLSDPYQLYVFLQKQ